MLKKLSVKNKIKAQFSNKLKFDYCKYIIYDTRGMLKNIDRKIEFKFLIREFN